MNKKSCPKSGKFWNNEHVNKIYEENGKVCFECTKCGRIDREDKTDCLLTILAALMRGVQK